MFRNVLIYFLTPLFLLVFLLGMTHDDTQFTQARLEMVRRQIEARGVRNPRVLHAMRQVERHLFVPPELAEFAYLDRPVPIGEGQTISQPYMVAFMTELLDLEPGHRVLEIGTGSGYQAAVLGRLAREVYSIEIIPTLRERADKLLKELGVLNVITRTGDGFLGWPEKAPFDRIMVTASPPEVPGPLLKQLAVGGRMVIPTGEGNEQVLRLIQKTKSGIEQKEVLPVRFVPMTGKAQEEQS